MRGGDPTMFPMFPWKDFLMGWITKIEKQKEEMDKSEKFKKTRRKEWRKEKEEIVKYVEIPILVCSPLVRNALRLPPWCDPPSGEPTCMGTSSTTKSLSVSPNLTFPEWNMCGELPLEWDVPEASAHSSCSQGVVIWGNTGIQGCNLV